MRGALTELDGIGPIEIEVGEPDFAVQFDASKLDENRILAALADAGESAKKRG